MFVKSLKLGNGECESSISGVPNLGDASVQKWIEITIFAIKMAFCENQKYVF
jgi:hypothetical protein